MINYQRDDIYKSISLLKSKESKARDDCSCKGICYINHTKMRWIKGHSDNFFQQMPTLLFSNASTSNEDSKSKNCAESEFKLMKKSKIKILQKADHSLKPLKSILKKK